MLKKVLTLSSGSAIGKVSGVIREVLFASFFGTSAIADAYRAALTLTLAPVHLFTSDALDSAFIPQFSKDRVNNRASAWSLFNGVGLMILFLSLVTGGVLYFFAQFWVSLVLPGFVGESFELVVLMIRVMAWGVPLYVLSALLIALDIANGNFRLAAIRPLVQNFGIITAIIAAFLSENPVWIAWWFAGTYLLFSIYEIIRLLRTGVLQEDWYRHWGDIRPATKRFWEAMKPMAFFSLIIQANAILEKAVASLIGPGAVATIDYARLIPETAQVLLIVPIGLVSLSAMVSLDDSVVSERTDRISAMILLLLIPLSGFLLVSAQEIITVIYGRGAFDENSIQLTSEALRGMAVGTWAASLSYVIHRIYNSRMKNRQVLRIGAAGIFVNATFNVLAYKYLGVMAIGLGFSLGGIVMAWLYIRGLDEKKLMKQVAKLSVLGVGPYIVIALLLINYQLPSLASLALQMIWCCMFWGAVFMAAPSTRDILRQFAGRITSLRERS